MRFFWCLAVCVALYSCSHKPAAPSTDCSRELGQSRGIRDGKSGKSPEIAFFQTCSDDSRAAAVGAYRDAYETARIKRSKEDAEAFLVPAAATLTAAGREPAAQSWVCEVEAGSKIFTGTGISKDEALGSAKATCVSHNHPSSCDSAECKQNL